MEDLVGLVGALAMVHAGALALYPLYRRYELACYIDKIQCTSMFNLFFMINGYWFTDNWSLTGLRWIKEL